MAEFELQKLWEKELQILNQIDAICKKHNISYYLMWGTLIGAVRHQGFIPWDDDIDICMPRKDYRKFLRIAKKELSAEYFLQTPFTDKFHSSFFSKVRLNNTAFYAEKDKNVKRHHGIFVDIIPLYSRKEKDSFFRKLKNRAAAKISEYISNKREGRLKKKFSIFHLFPQRLLIKIRDSLMKGRGDYYISWGYRFKKTDFYPAIEMSFEGQKYVAPNNYDEVLTIIYGDYMQLPPIEKQVAHKPAFISFNLNEDAEKLKHYLEELNAEQ